MFIIIWQYTINPTHLSKFIEHYNSMGTWAQFFEQSSDYIGTDFLQATIENQFITIDTWVSKQAYEKFLSENHQKYEEIDLLCEQLTIKEELIGAYHSQ